MTTIPFNLVSETFCQTVTDNFDFYEDGVVVIKEKVYRCDLFDSVYTYFCLFTLTSDVVTNFITFYFW